MSELAAWLGQITLALPTGYLEGAAGAAEDAARQLRAVQGDGSGLEAPIKQLEQARDTSQDIQANLHQVVLIIEDYITSVLGFSAAHTASKCAECWKSDEALPSSLEEHLFRGHSTPRRISGYHHRPGGIDRGEFWVVERQKAGADGVYRGSVQGNTMTGQSVRKNRSTFFPDHWPRSEVRQAVRVAFATREVVRDDDGAVIPRNWEGFYRGVRIQGYVRRGVEVESASLEDVATAYPVRPEPGERVS